MNPELPALYNADCMDIMREMPDKSVDMVITDPPYGNILTKPSGNGVLKDIMDRCGGKDWDYKPSREYFDEMLRISKKQVIWGGIYFSDYLPVSSCWIVWDKDRISAQSFSDCELAWTSFDTAIKRVKIIWDGFRVETDLGVDDSRIHPTQKPVKLFEWIIRNYAKEGDTICDPFFGSGSCLVAAIRLGHPIIGVEKEKVYFDAGKERIEKEMHQEKLTAWTFEEAAEGWV